LKQRQKCFIDFSLSIVLTHRLKIRVRVKVRVKVRVGVKVRVKFRPPQAPPQDEDEDEGDEYSPPPISMVFKNTYRITFILTVTLFLA
jgi:hypothetical protein